MMNQPFLGFGRRRVIVPDGIDRLPTMTGATTSGVTISCTDENTFGGGTYASWRGANKTNGDSFLTATGNASAIWKVDFGSGNAWVVQSYTMTEIHSGEYVSGARTPKNWVFEGSNDNSSWTTLDTQSGQTAVSANNKRTFPITNSTAYRYYRFNVNANGSGNLIGWAEVELKT